MNTTELTELTLLDAPTVYPPLPPIKLPHELDTARLLALNYTTVRSESWARIVASASSANEVRIVALGASTTMGCGSCDFSIAQAPEVAESARRAGCPSLHAHKLCSPAQSWARQMHDALTARWRAGRFLARPRTSIWAKNAVGPGYFAMCPDVRLPSLTNAHVILIELATNLFFGSLRDLVTRLREVAPDAVVGIVLWPPQVHAQEATAAIQAAARPSPTADVYDIGAAIGQLPRPRHQFYAQGGKDNVHPNALGHYLLGRLAAEALARSWEHGLTQLHARGGRRGEHLQAGEHGLMQLQHGAPSARPAALNSARNHTKRPRMWEMCYEQLPLQPCRTPGRARPAEPPRPPSVQPCFRGNLSRSRAFSLVDDAAASGKGVAKLGWASERPSQSLALGPLPGPPNTSCALLRLSLQHLATTIRERPRVKGQERGQADGRGRVWPGELRLRCFGCRCISEQVPSHWSISFPMHLPTGLHAIAELGAGNHLLNMSVTRPFAFLALWRSDAECVLHIEHVPPREMPPEAWRRGDSSRVRIDGLALTHQNMLLFASNMIAHRRSYPAGYALIMQELANGTQCAREILQGCHHGRNMSASKHKVSTFCALHGQSA